MKKNYKKTNFWIFYNYAKLETNFSVDEFGWHQSAPGYTFTEKRTNAIIQFVYSGTCRLTVWQGGCEKQFLVREGEAFVLRPGIGQCYVSDEHDPCSRYWLSFSGAECPDILNRCGLTADKFVFSGIDPKEAEEKFERFRACTNDRPETVFSIYANAFDILGMFARVNASESEPRESLSTNKLLVNSVAGYIEKNLGRRIMVSELAALFGYERSRFYRIFQSETGISVQQYISNLRITRARHLLSETDIPLSAIAEQLGYENYSSFSKNFFNRVGRNPSEYRAFNRGGEE